VNVEEAAVFLSDRGQRLRARSVEDLFKNTWFSRRSDVESRRTRCGTGRSRIHGSRFDRYRLMLILGLDTARRRERVDEFFETHRIRPPIWRQKLERLMPI
jgi:hypothetical protein